MDSGFQNAGFSADYSSNAFKILSNSFQAGGTATGGSMGTILRLDTHGFSAPYMSTSKGIKRKWSRINEPINQQVGSSLSLGLGLSSSSSDSKGSSATACTTISSAKESDEESSMELELDFTLHIGGENGTCPKEPISCLKAQGLKPQVDLELSLSMGPAESDITSVHQASSPFLLSMQRPLTVAGAVNADEGSMSYGWKEGMTHLSAQTSFMKHDNIPLSIIPDNISQNSAVPDISSSILSMPKSSITCTSGVTMQQHPHNRGSSKTCQIEGCGKGARGASGRCISHGGGRRCQKLGCQKGAEGRTVYCKAHGGGRRCEHLGCTKSAEGRTDFCIAHGGGRRCSHEGCTRAARGKSGLCIRHGGGKRCQVESCTRSAEGLSGLCISHGGGRRCQALECTKGAQGSTMFCKAHGGGKRCTEPGCTKGAEGSTPFCKGHGGGKRCEFHDGGVCTKSVHGGTNFCVAHGGGKRCVMPECTKSARGRTDFCVRHGGGKRCNFEGCGKSAQGSTDFCKAHGGGKRCSWGHYESEFDTHTGGPCNSFARGKKGFCSLHSGLIQDKRVHGGVVLGPIIDDSKLSKQEKTKDNLTVVNDIMNIDSMNIVSSTGTFLRAHHHHDILLDERSKSTVVPVPEGRVHGGSLLAMLRGSAAIDSSNNRGAISDPALPSESSPVPHNWMRVYLRMPMSILSFLI